MINLLTANQSLPHHCNDKSNIFITMYFLNKSLLLQLITQYTIGHLDYILFLQIALFCYILSL